MRVLVGVLFVFALGLPGAPPVSAETMLSAGAGAIFGGSLELPGNRLTYAASINHFAGDHLGFEFDVARTSDIIRSRTDTRVMTFVGSVVGRHRITEGWSAFGTLGLGGYRSQIYDVTRRRDVRNWHPCLSLGLGTMATRGHFGVRADLRYLEVIEEPDLADPFDRELGEFSAFRATAGLLVRF